MRKASKHNYAYVRYESVGDCVYVFEVACIPSAT